MSELRVTDGTGDLWQKEKSGDTPYKSVDKEHVEKPTLPRLSSLHPLQGTPGAYWLASKGITPEEASLSRSSYAPAWDEFDGRESQTARRVVFPLMNDRHKVVGWWTQAIDDFLGSGPEILSYGQTEEGVFKTHGAWNTEPILLTDSILDALSLASCGCPALALVERTWPEWILDKLRGRMIGIAFMNDEEGEHSSERLVAELSAYPVYWTRIRPLLRTWNGELQLLGNAAMKLRLNALLPDNPERSNGEAPEEKYIPHLLPQQLLDGLTDRGERVSWREWLLRDCMRGVKPKQRARYKREFAAWRETISHDPSRLLRRMIERSTPWKGKWETLMGSGTARIRLRNHPVEVQMAESFVSGTIRVDGQQSNRPKGECYRCGGESWLPHPKGVWVCGFCSLPKRSLRRAG